MQAIDYFKNKNNSREDKFNAYYQIDTVTRKSFLKKSISGKGNKAAFDELFNTVGFKLFRDLDYNDKAKWYAYLMTDKKNVSNVIESIINNEDSNTLVKKCCPRNFLGLTNLILLLFSYLCKLQK